MKDRIIYLDNAATTKVRPEVIEEMRPYFDEFYGNPSALYELGHEAKEAVENARKTIAKCINADSSEIYFTSGGSESDNWAIDIAVNSARRYSKNHIITSKIEHHAVLKKLKSLEERGYKVTYVDVDENGIVNVEQIKNAITEKTFLVTIMMVNNEIGSIQPIKEIGKICKDNYITFHTDAVQAAGHIPINVRELGVNMLSISGHKFHAPKGIGALYIKNHNPAKYSNNVGEVTPLIFGGNQERKLRAGTENVPYIVGMAKALEIAYDNEEFRNKHNKQYNTALRESLSQIKGIVINSNVNYCVPYIINFTVEDINSETLLLLLNKDSIYVSSGSACTSGDLEPSHVLKAMGLSDTAAYNSIRVSFSTLNDGSDLRHFVDKLEENIRMVRNISGR